MSGTAATTRQQTLAGEAVVRGIGFVTGADVTLRFRPAEADRGFVFVRTDLPNHPEIPALHGHLIPERRRRTALRANGAVVEMTEHVLAALAGLGVDNCIIELDAPETPGMDGSAGPFVEAILQAGIQPLDRPRRPMLTEGSVVVRDGDAMVAFHPSESGLEITYNLEYPVRGIGKQSLTTKITPETFRTEIAPARTFVLQAEVDALRQQGLGSRSTARDLLVFGEDGRPVDNALRFPDECVRHKILDVIGDLALVGRPVQGHVLAHKSGHALNGALVQQLCQRDEERARGELLRQKPLLDSTEIEKILPHRYPFLLVDRVVEMDPNRRAVGIKNVSYNEPFFQGHWPGRPVMPGVLIIEAMAQLAGLMCTQWHEQGGNAVLASISEVKWRRPVTPGDQLWLESESVRLRSRSAIVRTRALVGSEVAAEAQMHFVFVAGAAFT